MTIDNLGRLTEEMVADALADLQPVLDAVRAEKRAVDEAAARMGRLVATIELLASGMRFGLEAVQTARQELEKESEVPTP